MLTRTRLLVLALVLVVVISAAVAVGFAAGQSDYNGPQWEYLYVAHFGLEGDTALGLRPEMPSVVANGQVLEIEGYIWTFFNALGAQGWELVSGEVTDLHWLFKRKAE